MAAPVSQDDADEFSLGVTTMPASEVAPDLRANRSTGVRLDATGISWEHRGLSLRRQFREITSLRLECELGDGDAPSPTAALMFTLSFADGARLVVTSGPGVFRWRGQLRAVQDAGDRQAYVAFVTELHRRLGPDDRSRIAFLFGGEPTPLRFRLIFHAIFGGGVVLLPAGAALATGVPFLWLVAALGGCIMLVSEGLLRRGPRRYAPDAIPRNAVPPLGTLRPAPAVRAGGG